VIAPRINLAVFPLIITLFTLLASAPAHAEKRVALVVGNSVYVNVPQLVNPANDAKLMADTLRSLSFTLVGGGPQLDLDVNKFRSAMQDFGDQLQGADVGLFYYAGHGVQVRGSNYLVPVGANPTRESDVDLQMLDSNVVLRQMEGAGTKLSLMILDACRNNPFGGRGLRATDAGLAQMRAPEGTLISFATQPGAVAQDGNDSNSPYTKALAQAMRKPGLDVLKTFNEVGIAVARATNRTQEPWVSFSPLTGEFYFAGAGTGEPAPSANARPIIDPVAQAWAATKDTTSIAVLEDFIRQFGSTIYGSMARARVDELKKGQVAVVAPPVTPAVPSGPCGGAVAVTVSRSAAPLSAAEECSLQAKDTFKECANCPQMLVVPAGSFTMGSPASEPGRRSHEGPQHTVTIARQYAVGQFELTFDEWDACVAGGVCNGYQPSDHTDQGWGRGHRPVINVSWDDAKAYLAWVAKKTGKPYRLLTEAEYEYAARAGTTTAYPWGSAIGKNNANCDGCGSQWDNKQTAPVGSFAANGFGLYDMVGNVWAWTEDCYHDSYNGAPTDGSAWNRGDCGRRVLRGGAWYFDPQVLRSAFRGGDPYDVRAGYIGFRVGRTLMP